MNGFVLGSPGFVRFAVGVGLIHAGNDGEAKGFFFWRELRESTDGLQYWRILSLSFSGLVLYRTRIL